MLKHDGLVVSIRVGCSNLTLCPKFPKILMNKWYKHFKISTCVVFPRPPHILCSDKVASEFGAMFSYIRLKLNGQKGELWHGIHGKY